jgi:glycerol-3-phosphate dehydrogenase
MHPSREAALRALTAGSFDLAVIGGGITGCGIARDATLRGLRVALVERWDFASGTSSRSSRLVHGGVRYLEQGALSLVFEASAERRRLLRLAPHLVRPLEFTWPVYEGARVAGWKLAAGLALYDLLALFRNVGRHRRLRAQEILSREPALRERGLEGGASYWDAEANDARLTLVNAIDASQCGATVVNYASASALVREGSRIASVRVLDELTQHSLELRAKVVVNAAGAWSDHVRALDDAAEAGRATIRASKGAHVAVLRERIGNRGALTLLARDGRVFFVLPSGAHAIVGTTDTDTAAAPQEARATRSDVTYLLDAANDYFPEAHLTEDDVVSAWAGVRPLAVKHGRTSDAPTSASREHAITRSAGGLISITGGKLTTYRTMASAVTDVVERTLGRTASPSPTVDRPLPGGELANIARSIDDARIETGDAALARHLVRTYGSQWHDVWVHCSGVADGRSRLVEGLPYLAGEVHWSAEREMACTLGDLLIRRMLLAFETRDHGLSIAERAARIVAPVLGWNEAQRAREVERYREDVDGMFRID